MRALIIALAIAAAVWLLAIVALVIAGRRTHAKELAMLLPNLLSLLRGMIRDPRVGRFDKFLLVIAVAWVASPIDLIPEFIPVFGPLDDVVVVALILRRLVRRAGPEVVSDHWRGDPEIMRRILKLVRAA
ncbi:MAG: DUF1232 domain-containing protein [Actinobacteria bacterium]|nr:MAG: DUF1232 domain-containing protein [Actinomycetota bacterium]